MTTIKHRDLIFVFVMSIITLGIYYLYWSVETKNEIKSLGADIPTAFLIIIPIAHIYFWYKYAVGFVSYVEKKDDSTLILLYTLVLLFIPIVGILIIQNKLNKMATAK